MGRHGESALITTHHLVLFGYHLGVGRDGPDRVPTDDVAQNRWTTATIPGSEFFAHKSDGASVDLGPQYDPAPGLVWAVMSGLRPGAVQVTRFDETLKLEARSDAAER